MKQMWLPALAAVAAIAWPARRMRLETVQFLILTPLPGSETYDELESGDRIINRDWSQYDRYHIVYRTKGISAEDLHEKTLDVYLRTYSIGSILRRMPTKLRNIPPYFAINVSYRLGSKRLRRF